MDTKKTVNKSALFSKIKKILKKQGSYFPGLDFMIEITAGNLYAYYLLVKDVENLDTVEVTELTREGNEKKRAHPALRELRVQAEEVRKCLGDLGLTVSTAKGVNNDDIDELIKSVNSI